MRLQPYDLTIKYRQGKNMEVADTLSRLSPEEKEAIPNIPKSKYTKYTHNSATRCQNGSAWQVSETLKPYWTYREEITVEDGIAINDIDEASLQSMQHLPRNAEQPS